MRVLVTDGETNKALAVVRAIADATTEIGVASRFPVSPAGVSTAADRSHWLRDRSPDAMVAALNDLSDRYDQLLPVGGRTFELVSERREDLQFPVGRLFPDRSAMQTAVRKAETYALADSEGVPAPTTVVLSNESGVDAAGEVVGFPAVIKTGVETEPRFVRIVDDAPELAAAYREYRDDHDSDPIVQERLPGPGRGYFGLYADGDLVAGYAHRRIREYPPEGGASACAESERDAELRDYSRRLLSALDWSGVAMVEFKEAADGTPTVVEINPKFWGSLDLGIASGLNLPRALLASARGPAHASTTADAEDAGATVHAHAAAAGAAENVASRTETADPARTTTGGTRVATDGATPADTADAPDGAAPADTADAPDGYGSLRAAVGDSPFTPRRFHWPLSGDLTHAWRRPESAPAVFRDLVSPHTESNVRLSDPLPHVLEAAITFVRWDV